ncbi:MAG: hypothetical protein IJ297_01220 [Clostridia bacterium]|nr:hypothetical protein [Clostridia bacterium]
MNTKNIALINACANAGYLQVGTETVKSRRGLWGEMIEIDIPGGFIVGIVDENAEGWLKLYDGEFKKVSEVFVNSETVNDAMQKMINSANAKEQSISDTL